MSIFRTLSVTVVGAALAGAGVASAEIDGVAHDDAIKARAEAAATSTTVTPTPADSAGTASALPGVGATAVTGPFEVTLLAVEDPVAPDVVFAPDPGNRYVGVELEVRNTTAEPQTLSMLLAAEVVDSEGQAWSTSLFAVSDRATIDGEIPAGESRRGWVGFELPETSSGLRLFVDGVLFGDGEPATFALDAAAVTDQPAPTTTSSSSPSEATTAGTASALPGVGATAVTGPFEVTLLAVEDPVAPDVVFAPDPGNRYVGVELEVRNTTAEPQTLSMLLAAEVVDSEGQAWSTSLFAVSDRATIDGEIPAGETRRGWVGFELPETSSGLRLFVDGVLFGDGEPATFALDAAAAVTDPAAPTTTAAP